MYILHMDAAEQGMKLITFLAKRLTGQSAESSGETVSQGDLHRWIRTGQVRVNKGRAKAFDRLTAGDAVRLPPFASPLAKENTREVPVTAEDDLGHGVTVLAAHPDFLALEKPPLLPSQPGTGHDISLVSVLREYFSGSSRAETMKPRKDYTLFSPSTAAA
jgi:23S rRNA pseudouridine955/2504/2580 synthase